jgi:heme/copper-type cytochrome/quinol oxidase subunit 2
MIAATGSTWTEIVIMLSIFVPVAIAVVLTVYVLRGAKNDPDEQRWRRLEDKERSE